MNSSSSPFCAVTLIVAVVSSPVLFTFLILFPVSSSKLSILTPARISVAVAVTSYSSAVNLTTYLFSPSTNVASLPFTETLWSVASSDTPPILNVYLALCISSSAVTYT